MRTFRAKLEEVSRRAGSLVCVGLDPDPQRMAVRDVVAFNGEIIDATRDLVCAYKPQLAFYEALGLEGLHALDRTIRHIRDTAPGVIILGDGKRGDIGSTARAYAIAMFERWGFDATTVNAYQGADAVEPFLAYPGRGVFVVCRSSNPSSSEFQDLLLEDSRPRRLYERLAEAAARWDSGNENVGLVIGATRTPEIAQLRLAHPALSFLIPGVGFQGGDGPAAARAGANSAGRGVLISASRDILYASSDPRTFAAAARAAATQMRDAINAALRPAFPRNV